MFVFSQIGLGTKTTFGDYVDRRHRDHPVWHRGTGCQCRQNHSGVNRLQK